jgi:hypothetical protein
MLKTCRKNTAASYFFNYQSVRKICTTTPDLRNAMTPWFELKRNAIAHGYGL